MIIDFQVITSMGLQTLIGVASSVYVATQLNMYSGVRLKGDVLVEPS